MERPFHMADVDKLTERWNATLARQQASIDRLLADLAAQKAACTCGAAERVLSASEPERIGHEADPALVATDVGLLKPQKGA